MEELKVFRKVLMLVEYCKGCKTDIADSNDEEKCKKIDAEGSHP